MPLIRLEMAMAHIEAHPEEWDQSKWICGTKACLAGRIALMAGAVPAEHGLRTDVGRTVTFDGRAWDVRELAVELAGITSWEAQHLFNAGRTLPELRHDTQRLSADLALTCSPTDTMIEAEYYYTNEVGYICAASHRRTSFIKDNGMTTITDHRTRLDAYAWAAAEALKYDLTPNRNEPPREPVT